MMHRWFAPLGLFAALLLMCAPAVAAHATRETAQATVGTIAVAIPAGEAGLTPYNYVSGYPGYNLLSLVYDSVMLLDSNNIPRELLATNVSANDDGSAYDIRLRSDVQWHDGTPLTADDVKFTYEFFVAHPQGRFTTALRPVETITITGPGTLTIKLNAPSPAFPIRALADVPILPRHYWETVPTDQLKSVPATIGSGPYKLLQADPDSGYRLGANAGYFLGPPPISELIVPVVKDPNTALQALRAGEIQGWTRALTPEQVPQFSQAPFHVATGPGFGSTMLQLNNRRPILERTQVRNAIDLAIDKRKLVDVVLLGSGAVAAPGFIHPDSPLHDTSVDARFDPGQARQLLDDIGAQTGADGVRVLDGNALSFTLLVYANNPVWVRSAELIAAMLGDVGVNVSVRALDSTAVDDLVWPGFDAANVPNYEMALWGWSPPSQIDSSRLVDLVHADYSLGRNNIAGYQSLEATRFADALRTTADASVRQQLVKAIERQIALDTPFVMLFFQDGDFVYRVDGYDGWVYQKGQGIYNKLSFIPGFRH